MCNKSSKTLVYEDIYLVDLKLNILYTNVFLSSFTGIK